MSLRGGYPLYDPLHGFIEGAMTAAAPVAEVEPPRPELKTGGEGPSPATGAAAAAETAAGGELIVLALALALTAYCAGNMK